MNETQERKPPTIDEVVIAALLHNIDTVAQRAGDQPQALFTEYAGCFPKEIDPQLVGALAARHGSPIITEAARVASGVEGISNDDEEASAAEPLRPLQAIWPGIGENRFYCLATLEPEHTIPDKATVTIADYENVWQGFLSNFRQFDSMSLSPAEFIAALNALLEHWLWAVPYSTTDGCDVSLYDHSICTAACAAALYRYHEAEGALDDAEAIRNHTAQRFRFVVGDVSGIQRHIFDLKSDDRAAKLLRARSFALQLCSRDITRWIVRKLNLPPQSILYDAGGRFLLVVPNIDTAGQQLEEIADRVERWCLDHYLGEVSFSIAFCVTACTEDLTQKRFGAFMRQIGAAATEAKQQKLQRALLPEASEAPEDPHVLNLKVDQQLGICQLCDKHPATKVSDDADLCAQCARLVQLGKSIPKAGYLAFVDEEGARGDAPILLHLPSDRRVRLFGDGKQPSSRADCYALNRFEAGLPTWRLPFHLPTHDDGTDTQPPVTTFDKISEMDGKDFPRLAMLKADVDRLGWLFEGVSRGARGSLSRYMGMSRMLDYYFSARLQQIIERDACYDEAIYTVFAGGDDLCLIGPWQRILRLAGEVRRDFAGFVGGSGDVTFSAGVALVHQKVPVRTLAHSADENLEQAKEGGRDSITLFGITTPWEDGRLSPECLSKRAPSVESTPANQPQLGYRGLIEFGERLYCLITHEKLSSGSVYRLLDFSRRKKRACNGMMENRNLLWRSHLHYMLARNFGQNDSDDEEKRKERECLLSEIVTNIDRLPVAVHWALYRHRSEGEE